MEDVLCNIELVKDNNYFIARIQSEYNGTREYKSSNIEEVLEQMTMDLQEEFDSACWGGNLMANEIKMVCDEMDMLAEDTTIPRNIRRSAQEAKNNLLNEKYALDVRCAGAMNVLSDLTGDSNMPMQAYTLILQILSQLEKISKDYDASKGN